MTGGGQGETRCMAQLATVIREYMQAAEASQVPALDGKPYTPAGVRSLRRALTVIEAEAGAMDAAAVAGMDAPTLERLGEQVVDRASLPQGRLGSIMYALRSLSAYAADQADPPQPQPQSRPEPEPAPSFAPVDAELTPPPAAGEARTPTFAMLALGAHIGAWTERIIVIAFVLTAIGLALELV